MSDVPPLAAGRYERERSPENPIDKDPWRHRSLGMRCATCMFFVVKEVTTLKAQTTNNGRLGRCRRHAPTISGFPAVFEMDWCGDHKLDENK